MFNNTRSDRSTSFSHIVLITRVVQVKCDVLLHRVIFIVQTYYLRRSGRFFFLHCDFS